MGLFRSCGFEELTTPKSRNDACQVAKEAYAQAEAQKEEDEGKVQVSLPPGFPCRGDCYPGTQPPHGILKKSMGRLQVARLHLTSYPRLSQTTRTEPFIKKQYSVLQRDLKRAVIPLIYSVLLSLWRPS